MYKSKIKIFIIISIISIFIAGLVLSLIFLSKDNYDMSNVTFTSKIVEYNGTEHSLEITGELPPGVSVSYTTNKLKEVGTIEVTATFKGSSKYKEIPSMRATLEVIPKKIVIKIDDFTSIDFNKNIPNSYTFVKGNLTKEEINELNLNVIVDENIVNQNSKSGVYKNSLDLMYISNKNYDIQLIKGSYTLLGDEYCEVIFIHENDKKISYVRKNDKITNIPELPIIEGYDISWDYDFNKPVSDDLTIYSKKSEKTYYVYYYIGKLLEYVDEVKYNHEIIKRASEEKLGYAFSGWSEIPNIMPAHDLEVFGDFTIIEYCVIFDSNGGNDIDNLYFTIEDSQIILPTPIKDAHEFIGWYENNIKVQTLEYRNYNLLGQWKKDINPNNSEIYRYNDVTYINFGRYPQSLVTDSDLIQNLNLINEENSYGYIEYYGEEYKRVIGNPFYDDYVFSNGQTIIKDQIYYFKVEPIKWKVIEQKDNTYKLLSEMIIDNVQYYMDNSYHIYNNQRINENNYKYSNVRAWLNGYDGTTYDVEDYTNIGFYDLAFTESEKLLINYSFVDNSLISTNNNKNKYVCDNTSDKIYLLSRLDAMNQNYNFVSDPLNNLALVSDYTKAKNIIFDTQKNIGAGNWLLRSPYYNELATFEEAFYNYYMNLNGTIQYFICNNSYFGVRPAMEVTLNDEYHEVKFYDKYGDIIKREFVKDNSSVTPPEMSDLDNYLFNGWDKSLLNVLGTLEVYPIYDAKKYKISFDPDNGDEIKTDNYSIDDKYYLFYTPKKEGYTFLGWYENDVKIDAVEYRDHSLVAKWEKDDTSVKIDLYEENGLKYINFGRYPQSMVTNENLINSLRKIYTTNSNNYIEYNGNEYLEYKYNSWQDCTLSNGLTLKHGEKYYFIVEPIKWRVLEEVDGCYNLLSEYILDDISYTNISLHTTKFIDNKIIYPNDYQYSKIRAWLNGYDGTSYNENNYEGKGFYNIAFNDEEKKFIEYTLVNNVSLRSENTINEVVYYDTYDLIYLLSVGDVTNPKYGFSESYYNDSDSRIGSVTDYKMRYGFTLSTWYLRDPDLQYNLDVGYITYSVTDKGYVDNFYTNCGVRPAMKISFDRPSYQVKFFDYDNTLLKINYVNNSNSIIVPPTPERIGYTFIGWDQDFSNITTDLEIYAVYEKNNDALINIYQENGQTFINFGKYPQTLVNDTSLINNLDKINNLNNFGYIEYKGEEYKKVVAYANYLDITFNNGTVIQSGQTYYFRVEPIKWRVLEQNGDTYQLLSEMILDYQKFNNAQCDIRVIDNQIIYPNNYEYSYIRAWLNGYNGTSYNVENFEGLGFYNVAFNTEEKSLINVKYLDNSILSTNDVQNNYVCKDTYDRIYLLSVRDILNINYNFDNILSKLLSRTAGVSDYVRALGSDVEPFVGHYGTSSWMLRTPYYNSSNLGDSYIIDRYGKLDYNLNIESAGIRPAIEITLNKPDYEVKFIDYDGTIISTEYVRPNSSATSPEVPNHIGRKFIGWDHNYIDVVCDMEIYAQYELIDYKITFDTKSETAIGDMYFNVEDEVRLPIPVKSFYEFIGWYDNDVLVEYLVCKDYNLTAKWERKTEEIKCYVENDITYVNIGRYPQTLVTNQNTINALKNKTELNENGYIEYNGNEYKAMKSSIDYIFPNESSVKSGETYYFKVEPIKWRVIKQDGNNYTIITEKIICKIPFNYYTEFTYDDSFVRAWLNGYDSYSSSMVWPLFNRAFTSKENKHINISTIDGLNDKVYILSYDEIKDESYNLNTNTLRKTMHTDLSLCCSITSSYTDSLYGHWWLRSPGMEDILYCDVYAVSDKGELYSLPTWDSVGVRPVMEITID